MSGARWIRVAAMPSPSAIVRALVALAAMGCRGRFDAIIDGSSGRDAGRDGATMSDGTQIVDGASTLCGNSVVDSGEECDDGGPTAACSATCTLVDQGPGGTCVAPKVLVLARTATGHGALATGDTSTATNGAQVSCTAANTKDHTYSVVVAAAETLAAAVTPTTNWDTALAVRDGSLACNQSTTICCVSMAPSGQSETTPCSVPAGTMMIVVDSASGTQAGPYTLVVGAP